MGAASEASIEGVIPKEWTRHMFSPPIDKIFPYPPLIPSLSLELSTKYPANHQIFIIVDKMDKITILSIERKSWKKK